PAPPRGPAVVPPTLPPTPHPSGPRVRPAAVPPPPPARGEGKGTQLGSLGDFSFSSSAEHEALPVPGGGTNVTLTKVKGARQHAAADQLVEAVIDQALVDELLREADPAAAPQVVDVLPVDAEKLARAHRQRQRLIKIVVGSIAATVLGYMLIYFL